MENLDVQAINDILSTKKSIKIGIDNSDIILLAVAIIGAIVIGGIILRAMVKLFNLQ